LVGQGQHRCVQPVQEEPCQQVEIRSRFGPYFSVAGQQQRGTRLVAYHLVRNGG